MNIYSNVKLNPRPATLLDKCITQLGGGTSDMSTINLHQHHQPKPAPEDLIQCTACQRLFETDDDFNFHKETQLGHEDCSILKSMLAS
jgi:hypothetical protein